MLSDRPQNYDANLDNRCKILCLWKSSHWRWIHVWILWLFYFCHFFFQLWKVFSFGFLRGFNIAVHINSKIVVQCLIFNSKFFFNDSKSRYFTHFQKLVKLSTIIFWPGSSMLSNVIGWNASCFVFEVSFVNRRLWTYSSFIPINRHFISRQCWQTVNH